MSGLALVIRHEAAHAAAAILLGRELEEVRVDRPGVDGALGLCRTKKPPAGEGYDGRDMLISLVGYLAESRRGWPPAYHAACDEERDAICILVACLGLGEREWDALCELAAEMLEDARFRRAAGVIERALSRCPVLSGPDVVQLVAMGATTTQQRAVCAAAPQLRTPRVGDASDPAATISGSRPRLMSKSPPAPAPRGRLAFSGRSGSPSVAS